MGDFDQNKRFLIYPNSIVVFLSLFSEKEQESLFSILNHHGFNTSDTGTYFKVPRFISMNGEKIDMAKVVGKNFGKYLPHEQRKIFVKSFSQEIDFDKIKKHAHSFAEFVEKNRGKIIKALTMYETIKVAEDEIDRVLDLFYNLDENKSFFKRKINGFLAFLPRNQPFYALSCFGLVISYMSEKTWIYIPAAMKSFFPFLMKELRMEDFFPNITISNERNWLIKECSNLIYNKESNLYLSSIDAVIFTGTPQNAKKVRALFEENVLFIGNGAGHNPVVVTESADLNSAVEAVIELQLYNQGQDCANPASILVQKNILNKFLKLLLKRIGKVKTGNYKDKGVMVGPMTKIEDLEKAQKILTKNHEWIHPKTPGTLKVGTKIVEPTIILKPLNLGGNYTEQLSPIFFVQEYNSDEELKLYFENNKYFENAMYVTVYGSSEYINNLTSYRLLNNKIVHDKNTILINTHLHKRGVERGTQPYGGYGRGASWLSKDGNVTSKPTLPQRDIFERLILPSIEEENIVALNREIEKSLNMPKMFDYSEQNDSII